MRIASPIGGAWSRGPVRQVAVLDAMRGRDLAVPHECVAHCPSAANVRVEDLGHALLAVAHFGDISLIDVAVLLLFLAGCSGDRIDLGDGLSQHLREFHLVRPQSCDLLVHVLLLALVGVAVVLHDVGQLVHQVLELAPLQRHEVVEVAAVHLPVDALPGAGPRRLHLRGRRRLPQLQQRGGRGPPRAEDLAQGLLHARRPADPGREGGVVSLHRDAAVGRVADLELGQGVRVVAVRVGALGQLQDGGEDILVVLAQRQLVRILLAG
mmetsp:Transcript_86482/g.229218  ORF Transcript_86482/g.229218 Transcript_86482/m.229218 type:complete len:267 (+) Transcript_86482:340-1140(+)